MAGRSREWGSMRNLPFIVTLWLCLSATVHIGQIHAQTGSFTSWTFTNCSAEVQAEFLKSFPEFQSRTRFGSSNESSGSGSSFEKLLFSRTQELYRTEFSSSTRPTPQVFSKDSILASSSGTPITTGAFGRFPKSKPMTVGFLPPIDTWNRTILIVSGCTTCANGCCDDVDIQLDCGSMDVPLDYKVPGGTRIGLSVYRVRLVTPQLLPSNRTHLWLLQGGPGFSGLMLFPLAVPALQFATDVYIPDHRGTGFSHALRCPQLEAQMLTAPTYADCVFDCISQSASQDVDFKKFTVTAAAQDLEKMIMSARSLFAPKAVFVHGYSYGTRWAQRFLQMFPNVADKVVLEGVMAKDTVFNDFAIGSQIAGTRFMEKCLANSKCAMFFNSTSLGQTIDAIASQGTTNICSLFILGTQITSMLVRQKVQDLLYIGLKSGVDGPYRNIREFESNELFLDHRTFNLALIHHWKNCQSKKSFRAFAAGLSYIMPLYDGGVTDTTMEHTSSTTHLEQYLIDNEIMYNMIAYSELRRYPMDNASVYNAATQNVDWGPVLDFDIELALSDAWGSVKYPSDGFMGGSPTNVQSELLIINGEIDGQTPRPQAFATFNDITMAGGANKTIACIRDQGHHASRFGCGLNVVRSFYAGTPDTTCAMTNPNEAVQPLSTNFDIPEPFSNILFGLSSPFDGNEASDFCGPETTGPSGEQACGRCLDYCIMTADNGERSFCSCLEDLSRCYAKADLPNAVEKCNSTRTTYEEFFDGRIFSECSSACSLEGTGGTALTPGEIVAIVFGSILGGIVLVAVFHYLCRAGERMPPREGADNGGMV